MLFSMQLPDAGGRVRTFSKYLTVILVSIAMSACSLMPTSRDLSRSEVIAKATAPSDTSVDLDTAKKILNGWRNEYAEASQKRRRWQLGFGEALFYGSVFAILGAATNHDHLRNLGIAVASGSNLMSEHYQTGAQLAAFRKAVKKLNCMEEATMQITPEDERWFPDIDDAKQKTTLVELPAKLINRVEKVRTELGDTLNNIELSTPSKDAIAKTFQDWLAKKNAEVKSAVSSEEKKGALRGLADPDAARKLQIRKDRFIAALNKVSEEIEVCLAIPGG